MSVPSSQPVPGLPILEKYELLEEIGHGGMATVYRALDPRLSREVAVKVIHKHLRENAEVATRFVAEARAAAKLRHPGIVEVYDVSNEDDQERYLVVELLRGATLRKVLQQHREMPAEVGASIVLQLCDALEHAHESGIIHRDIKPENVLIELAADREASSRPSPMSGPPTDRDPAPPAVASVVRAVNISDTQPSLRDEVAPRGTHRDKKPKEAKKPDSAKKPRTTENVVIKITDFGIAKILDAQGVTSTGQVLGSPAHMAPEQIEGGDVDARTDVFALGVLMYECLVGHLPFEGRNPAQVLRKVLDGIYQPADRERASVGGRWAKVLAGALARETSDRTASPAALAEAIKTELAALGVADPRREIDTYFHDPAGYKEALVARLVPRLIARGEAARKKGDVPSAAADFNRALALAPNDLAILKRVAGLTTSESRRQLARRIASVVGAAAIAGLTAFGVTKLLKRSALDSEGESNAVDETAGGPAPFPVRVRPRASARPSAEPKAVASAAPSASAAPRVTPPVSTHVAAHASSGHAAVLPAAKRKVRFVVTPSGASLNLDGQDVAWAGTTFTLGIGAHSVKASIQSPCCKPLERQVDVTPAPSDQPDDIQTIRLPLDLYPATLVVTGGPADGKYICDSVYGLSGEKKHVKLSRVFSRESCAFKSSAGDKRSAITLRAGEETRVPWPL